MQAKSRTVRSFNGGVLFVAVAFLIALVGVVSSAGASEEGVVEGVAPPPPQISDSESQPEGDLDSKEAQELRLASRTAFTELSAPEAAELLQATFADQLALLNSDPARYLSDVKMVAPAGETAATVSDEGNGLLLEAGIPVRTETEAGELKKVDLSLIATPSGFETENAIADVQIPDEAGGAIELSETGLGISASAADPEAEGELVGDKLVQYTEILPDTDMLVAPIGKGVEIFNQLRSPASPETLHFQLAIDNDAQVVLNGAGGADISLDSEVVASVAPPTAVDAQGTPVEVELQVEGQTLELQVAHRELDFAYPILVDPVIQPIFENYENAWYFGGGLESLDNTSVWQYETNDPNQQYLIRSRSCIEAALCSPSTRGLYITSVRGNLPAGIWGQWVYAVPGTTTYIPSIYPEHSAFLNPFFRSNYDTKEKKECTYNSYKNPYDYSGAFTGTTWNWYEKDRAQFYGNTYMFTQAKGVGFGMNTGPGVNIPCRRHIMLGGYMIRLDDPEKPTLGVPSGVPTGWLKAGQSVAITANATDPGLGVQNFFVSPDGALPFPLTPEQNQCPGTKPKPCPASANGNVNTSVTAFSQGISTVSLTAKDPTGEVSNTRSWQLKVDRTAPTIDLDGQLATATDEDFIASTPKEEEEKDPKKWDELKLPVYNLTVTAKDGSTSSDLAKRSGVKDIEIWLDGVEQAVTWSPQECPATSCGMTKTYELDLIDDLTSGKHTLKVVALDQLSQKEERSIEFEYVPATGISDDYLLRRFPLPDGKDHEGELANQGPELTVNVLNGNLAYHELDVDVEGVAADLEVERFYNSQLPANEDTEWGDGWSLAQAPEIDPVGGGTPTEAVVRSSTGELVRKVALPTSNGSTKFDPKLQAAVTKKAGAYVVEDEGDSTDTAEVFSESGRIEEVEVGNYASIDYSYDGSDLAEIAVDDPASSQLLPEEVDGQEEDFTPEYASSFGSYGTGNGQFNHPGGLDMAPDGTLWIADSVNDRVLHFEADGDYLGKIGSPGEGNGQLDKPVDIEVDAAGNIWVADANNDRLQKFSPAGTYLQKIGGYGSTDGKLIRPEGIALEASGNIWVADTGNNRLQRFTAGGEFRKKIGSFGAGEGQISEPMGIDIGPGGNLFIADWDNDRVVVFSGEGTFVRQFGIQGEGDGQFRGPVAIEVDGDGLVWVSDEKNERIEQFSQNGEYVTQFGEEGSGDGELELANPMGIVTDNVGNIFFTDSDNDRVQRWRLGGEELPPPTYAATVGSSGTGNGQYNQPAGLELAPDGTFWVADSDNNRVVHLKADGSYLGKFGSLGTGNGQLERPVDVEVDATGNVYVADAGNDRIQKFNSSGVYQSKFGSFGTGNGQFNSPEGIAIDTAGNIWVTDTGNNRVQKFSSAGVFQKIISAAGSGQGQLTEPMGIDVGPGGGVLVADWDNNRVVVFNSEGSFVRQFGIEGYGGGEFRNPVALDVDPSGYVWVSDEKNERIEQFDQGGNFLSQFGTEGSGEGEMELTNPMGIVTDTSGNLYLTDSSNDRIQRWELPDYEPAPEPELAEDDPAVEIETPSGLVSSVEGEEAGEHSYVHSGDDLVSYAGPEGETKYVYDGNGQMTKVTLPNGTVGTIAYWSDKRVKSVTVDPAGADPAKTTQFEYSDEPRRTVVIPDDAPVITYDIGSWDLEKNEGGIFRWTSVSSGAVFSDFAGSLYAFKETEAPISVGDHNLYIEARSFEGVSEIQFIVNGTDLVDEKTCEQNLEVPGIECKVVYNEWVVNTADLAPGITTVEVIVRDRIGRTVSSRFWVNIPYTPPPAAGPMPPPKYADILLFREEHGLDIDLDPVLDEEELNDRIYNSIGAWHNPETPAGQVARASQERWGVPLRAVDVAELEWRLQYWEQASQVIPAWAASNAPSTFAGAYIDERAGGLVRVGFTGSQAAATLASLEQTAGLMVQPERVVGFSTAPQHSLPSLEGLEAQVNTAAGGYPTGLITGVGVDIPSNSVSVGASNTSQAQSLLQGSFGAQAPITVHYQPGQRERKAGRERVGGMVRAGDEILHKYPGGENEPVGPCTAAFGAFDKAKKATTGETVFRYFAMSAGHCAWVGTPVLRRSNPNPSPTEKQEIGVVRRNGDEYEDPAIDVDANAIRLEKPAYVPRQIFQAEGMLPIDVTSAWTVPGVGANLCFSGRTSGNILRCGPILRPPSVTSYGHGDRYLEVCFEEYIWGGDSGSPVWVEGSGVAVGIAISGFGGPEEPGLSPSEILEEEQNPKEACASLLLPIPNRPAEATVFGSPELGPLHLVTKTNAQ